MKLRQALCGDGLLKTVRSRFEYVRDTFDRATKIPLADALMSGFAIFSLKDPSLLAFDERRAVDNNLHSVYKIGTVPCDTQMRARLDEVSPNDISPVFKDIFRSAQRGKVLEQMVFFNGCYLLSLDGTGYFSSNTIHCESCLEKKNSKTGDVSYSHQMLGAAIVHPDFKEVIPVAPEPIIKQDGDSKNDCERNAAKRFLEKFRKDHPHLPTIIIEDALSSNAPHIEELKQHRMHFILGVKEGDHAFLFNYVREAHDQGQTTTYECKANGVIHRFEFINEVPLNASNQELLVNFIEYRELHPDAPTKNKHFCWVTDLAVHKESVYRIMRGGRARWKIENETFNTLKNQGYHFEHNYGHGKKNLSVIFAMLMMLAFLVDQIQQLACPLFQAAWKKQGSKKKLWENMKSLFHYFSFDSMQALFEALLYGVKVEPPVVLNSS